MAAELERHGQAPDCRREFCRVTAVDYAGLRADVSVALLGAGIECFRHARVSVRRGIGITKLRRS